MARNIFQEISRKEAQSILKENWKNTIKNGSKIHDLPFATFLDKSQLFLDKAQLFMKSFDIDFYQFGNLGWVFCALDWISLRLHGYQDIFTILGYLPYFFMEFYVGGLCVEIFVQNCNGFQGDLPCGIGILPGSWKPPTKHLHGQKLGGHLAFQWSSALIAASHIT